jgi:SAM-dependent methyltransferase
MTTDWFAGRVAETYDDDRETASPEAVEPVVDFLAARGVPVCGIELSQDMVVQLRRKGSDIPVALGDMATTRLEERFSLVYLVYNTICNLTTQEAQVACFRNAAAHLAPGGSFVIEVGVPDLRRLPPGERFVPFDVSPHHVGVDEYDTVTQSLVSHHYSLDGSGVSQISMPFRYVWPSELDLMAQLAGLRLAERWGGWRREPFTADSRSHVSVWRKDA